MLSNNNKITTVIVLVMVACCATGKELAPEKLRKSFHKIDQLLAKYVVSADDIKANVAVFPTLLQSKSNGLMSKLGGTSSIIEPIEMLIKFTAELPKDRYNCESGQRRKLAEDLDSGLSNESRSASPNYPLDRVDKIIERFAYLEAVRCGLDENLPSMEHAYKQLAYDQIEARLVKELPDTEDAEANLMKVEEMLHGLTPQDGALAVAMKQFVDLKSLSSESSCGESGSEILVKNDLATRREIHEPEVPRRVSKVLAQVSLKHEQLCRPIYIERVKSQLSLLYEGHYRTVLALVSGSYLPKVDGMKIRSDLEAKRFNPDDFSIPLMADRFKSEMEKSDVKGLFKVDQFKTLNPTQIYHFLEDQLMGKSDIKYLRTLTTGSRPLPFVDGDRLNSILHTHIFRDCKEFLKRLRKDVEAAEFGVATHPEQVLAYYRQQPAKALSYHMVRAGYFTCRSLNENQQTVYNEIQKIASRFG